MIRIQVGNCYVEFVTEDRLILTNDQEKAGVFSSEGADKAHELVKWHLEAPISSTRAN
jgi:hypothetical protein